MVQFYKKEIFGDLFSWMAVSGAEVSYSIWSLPSRSILPSRIILVLLVSRKSKFAATNSSAWSFICIMDQLHDTRAPFWTGIGTGSRARQVQDPNGGSRVSFRFWPRKKTIPSSSLSFLAAKKTLYLYPFSVVRTSAQWIKTKQKSAPKNRSSQTCESEAGSSLALDLERLSGGFVLVDLLMKGFRKT